MEAFENHCRHFWWEAGGSVKKSRSKGWTIGGRTGMGWVGGSCVHQSGPANQFGQPRWVAKWANPGQHMWPARRTQPMLNRTSAGRLVKEQTVFHLSSSSLDLQIDVGQERAGGATISLDNMGSQNYDGKIDMMVVTIMPMIRQWWWWRHGWWLRRVLKLCNPPAAARLMEVTTLLYSFIIVGITKWLLSPLRYQEHNLIIKVEDSFHWGALLQKIMRSKDQEWSHDPFFSFFKDSLHPLVLRLLFHLKDFQIFMSWSLERSMPPAGWQWWDKKKKRNWDVLGFHKI